MVVYMASGSILELRDVHFSWGQIKVLCGVTLSIGGGDVVAVYGRSGSGKTTLVKIATLILKPLSGDVIFLGKRASRLRESEKAYLRLRYIGYVDQFSSLIPNISLLDNVALPLRLLGYGKREAYEEAYNAMKLLGIHTLADKLPNEVSGGQRQRAAIARALAKKPILFVGDEPFSNLDRESEEEAFNAIVNTVAESGGAVLITSTSRLDEKRITRSYVLTNARLAPVENHRRNSL